MVLPPQHAPVCLSLALNTIGSLYRSFCVDMLPSLNALVAVVFSALLVVPVVLEGADLDDAVAAASLAVDAAGEGDSRGEALCRCLALLS